MSNDNDREVNEVLQQLRDLHLRQASLVERLLEISEENRATSTTRENTPNTVVITTALTQTRNRKFKVGDYVRVNNPRPLQFREGTVTKIGAAQVTVQGTSGKTLSRLPRNLTLLTPTSS
jgi:hypothetical protein